MADADVLPARDAVKGAAAEPNAPPLGKQEVVAPKDLDTGRWVGPYSRGEGTRQEAVDALGQALLNYIQSACPLQNGPVKGEPEAPSGLHQVLVLLLQAL
ncbi:replication factor C subunit 2 [Platysternon megacephalum]|uniref:Replication factor C subunit 2 n=1 Tax=Platysternon megacephalum TaxID=55544 RepID=A0A4D9EVW6_9SAUR|nr:replication factor C subunit 2 [Platysternon megacephalum]